MSAEKQIKILAFGDVRGKFTQFAGKIDQLNQKAGPFDAVLCVGEFLGPDNSNDAIFSKSIAFAVPVYILGCACPQHAKYFQRSGDELCHNLTYLGQKGILHLSSGLTIAYLSGLEAAVDAVQSSSSTSFLFDEHTYKEFIIPIVAGSMAFDGVDVLLTNQWPADVTRFANSQPPPAASGSPPASVLVARIATELKPRYHFAGSNDAFYKRQPYRNHTVLMEQPRHVTRFVGLGLLDSPAGQQCVYAFNAVPLRYIPRTKLVEQPGDTTEFPYASVVLHALNEQHTKRRRGEDNDQPQQYFFDAQAVNAHANDNLQQQHNRGGRKRPANKDSMAAHGQQGGGPPAACWFCLSSPDVEKHLIVTVGDSAYLALAKGGLTPDHVLILSIDHVQSLVCATEETRAEVYRFKEALVGCFKQSGKSVVLFERNYRTQHLQIQVVPVPANLSAAALKEAFMNTADLMNVELVELDEGTAVWDIVNIGCPYFYAELPGGARLLCRHMRNFPIQFGREVLASPAVLNMPERGDWKACTASKKEETTLATSFQMKFKPFDFTDE